ncbi:adenosine receptor A3-like [Biomphalaria glabrata]|uniref:Adenosine receptor A3-like n=1 Tax=Biomphalaria glabrata TaxID=6526 RepID=A0A9W2ZTA0_BIOGL|nr:adenosine receptor A3-like [Biomphalaria glabrata]
MLESFNFDYLTQLKEATNHSFVFLEHRNVIISHNVFIVVCLIYIPSIVLVNTLVFWGIVLYPGFHTTNNYLLLSLSIADFLMGSYCIPMYVLSYIKDTSPTILGNRTACLTLFASKQLAGSGSLLSLFLISVDRFIAITWPFRYPFLINEKKILRLIVIQWLLLTFLSFLPMMGLNNYNPAVCPLILRCNYFTTLPSLYVLIWMCFICAAISISAALHIRIIFIAIRQVSRFKSELGTLSRDQITQFHNRVSSVKLTSFLMLVFVILYLPYVLITPFKYLNLFSEVTIEIIQVVAQLFTFGNSLANGPIYAIARTEYKQVYMTMLTAYPWRWKIALRNLHREQHSSLYDSYPGTPRPSRAFSVKTFSGISKSSSEAV